MCEAITEFLEYKDGAIFWKKKPKNSTIQIGDRAGYFYRPKGYRRVKLKGVAYSEHRIIWYLVYGKWPDQDLDHINRNKIDNRVENLREATASMNMLNRAYSLDRGLPPYVYPDGNGFKVQYRENGKYRYLGNFSSPDEANAAYLSREVAK